MYKSLKIGRIKTSRKELIDIVKAWLVLSLAFTFVYSGIRLFSVARIFSAEFFLYFMASLFTAGLGFLLHELAHKFSAQKYGCTAEFRAFDQMLLLALGLAFIVGFIFAAPGAVMISGIITRKENGIISAAGPLTNYVLGIIFLFLMIFAPLVFPIGAGTINVWSIGFFINIWLGLFNMIPFGNFDGKKILSWNRYVWLAMAAFGFVLAFYPKAVLDLLA